MMVAQKPQRALTQRPTEGFTTAEIAAYYADRVPDLKQAGAGQWRGPCPIHYGNDANFAVDVETGRWYCHSQCGRGGSIIKLEMELTGAEFTQAQEEVLRIVGRTWQAVATYVYTDESGHPLYRVTRRERGEGAAREKTFHIERYKQGQWINGLGKTRRVPYRLHEVVRFRRVFIAEGEKCAKAIRKQLRLVATTNPMGADKWPLDFAEHFMGKRVIILPDNDEKGRKHALAVAASLLPVATEVRMLELPGLLEKGDVADWVEAGGTRAKHWPMPVRLWTTRSSRNCGAAGASTSLPRDAALTARRIVLVGQAR